MDCLFCKIIKGEIPSYTLYEDELVKVILDAYPENDGHTLIIPKKHYETIDELDNEIIVHINKIAKDIKNLLMKKLNKKGITYVVNYGDSQMIKHFHLHLIPDFHHKVTKKKELKEIYDILK